MTNMRTLTTITTTKTPAAPQIIIVNGNDLESLSSSWWTSAVTSNETGLNTTFKNKTASILKN